MYKDHLDNKTILITGASSGIGYQTALLLAKAGYRLIMPCKNTSTAENTYKNLQNHMNLKNSDPSILSTPILDLSDLESINKFKNEAVAKGIEIDILILNAGLQYTGAKKPIKSVQGYELTFAVNHLGHYYLTRLLLPLILKSDNPRIIITSSEVHNPKSSGGSIGRKASLNNLQGINYHQAFDMLDGISEFNADKAYKDSKLCNILFARHLSKILIDKNLEVPVIAWAPGLIIPKGNQGFFRYSRQYNNVGQIIFAFLARDVLKFSDSPKNAGRILFEISTKEQYSSPGFRYYSNRVMGFGRFQFEESEISNEAMNDQLAKDLWVSSSKLINIDSEFNI